MKLMTTAAFLFAATSVAADICDFRPSRMAGEAGEAAKSAAFSTVNSAKALGAYTLENPVSGASMISAGVGTATSAATGASGALGTAAAVATAPVTIAIAGATAVALGGYEGVCHFRAERITDYDEILYIVTNLAANSDPTMFALISEGTEYTNLKGNPAMAGETKIRVAAPGVGPFIFDAADLYIRDGVLMHRETLRDTVIGNVGLRVVEVEEVAPPE